MRSALINTLYGIICPGTAIAYLNLITCLSVCISRFVFPCSEQEYNAMSYLPFLLFPAACQSANQPTPTDTTQPASLEPSEQDENLLLPHPFHDPSLLLVAPLSAIWTYYGQLSSGTTFLLAVVVLRELLAAVSLVTPPPPKFESRL